MTGRGQKSSSQGRSAGEKRVPSTISHWLFDNWGSKHADGLWDAFQKGLTGYLEIEPDYGQIIAAGGHLDDDIVLQSGVIPDADTGMDDQGWEHHPAVELELGQPRRAYMAAVGDAGGHEIGAWDWFIYPGL